MYIKRVWNCFNEVTQSCCYRIYVRKHRCSEHLALVNLWQFDHNLTSSSVSIIICLHGNTGSSRWECTIFFEVRRSRNIYFVLWYCMDRVSFCNIYVIQKDTQYLMINFIHNIQQLNVFRTSIVHLQERSYAVCCNLVCLDMSCYEGEGRNSSFTLINKTLSCVDLQYFGKWY